MNYKEPTDEQLKLMQDYSDLCGKAMDIILKCENNPMLQNSSSRMQEAMMWFHSYVINGGKLDVENKMQ
jgi:hypothetical protein